MGVLVSFRGKDASWVHEATGRVDSAFTESDKLVSTCQILKDWLGTKDFIYSMTGSESETELRAWANSEANYVEDINNGNLVSVKGPRREVLNYLTSFLEIYSLRRLTLPNRVILLSSK